MDNPESLPPLPEPINKGSIGFGQLWRPLFSDDQMHAYARASIAAQPSGWRPIETAPLLEIVLLCSQKNNSRWIGRWDDYRVHNQPRISHWMPLPAAPGAQPSTESAPQRQGPYNPATGEPWRLSDPEIMAETARELEAMKADPELARQFLHDAGISPDIAPQAPVFSGYFRVVDGPAAADSHLLKWDDESEIQDQGAPPHAQPAPAVAANGWKWVPVEPTDSMLDATYASQPISDIWGDMLAASPSAPLVAPVLTDMVLLIQGLEQCAAESDGITVGVPSELIGELLRILAATPQPAPTAPAREPLTERQITEILTSVFASSWGIPYAGESAWPIRLAQAIERAHGIGTAAPKETP